VSTMRSGTVRRLGATERAGRSTNVRPANGVKPPVPPRPSAAIASPTTSLRSPCAGICVWFRWGLLRSVKDLRNRPCRSANRGPHKSFWSVQKVKLDQYNRCIRWPFGKKVPSQQDPTEPSRLSYVSRDNVPSRNGSNTRSSNSRANRAASTFKHTRQFSLPSTARRVYGLR